MEIAAIGVVILLLVNGCVLIDPKADNLPNIYGGRSSYYIFSTSTATNTTPVGAVNDALSDDTLVLVIVCPSALIITTFLPAALWRLLFYSIL